MLEINILESTRDFSNTGHPCVEPPNSNCGGVNNVCVNRSCGGSINNSSCTNHQTGCNGAMNTGIVCGMYS